ncbi:hypothetical protein [Glycomyces harbinensis]|uniref:Tetratricopeptide repeat-containing protein n=1 Tax=Glycomyces harbinensis TaxID=58114 RepID=A0A1G6XPT1_9ACTN|nr:hypothetical protein [Glycomyces harbinensis]SDD80188.1 hypothetical protein SAMN05216270_107283 [Glycomyces harbinensis]
MNSDLRAQIAELQVRLQRYLADDDASGLLAPDTLTLLGAIDAPLRGREILAPPTLIALLGKSRFARFQVLPEPEGMRELEQAVLWFSRLRRLRPDLVPAGIAALFDNGQFIPGDPEFADPEFLTDEQMNTAIGELEELAAGGEQRTRWLVALAAYLVARYERGGRDVDLDDAVRAGRAVLADPHASVQEVQAGGANLAAALLSRYQRWTDRAALDEAVGLYAASAADRGSAADHANAAMAHLTRFEALAEPPDLDRAERHGRSAVVSTSAGDPSLPARLSNLSMVYRARYEVSADADALREAVDLAEQALEHGEAGLPERARRQSNLCVVLATRFDVTRDRSDLDRAVEFGRLSLEPGLADGAQSRVSNLMLALQTRGGRYGQVADLQEALRLGREMADRLPHGHADRLDLLSNAAGAAMTWFDWTGDLDAIDAAVALGRETVGDATPAARPWLLHTNLSMHLLARFEAYEQPEDLDAAVHHAEVGAADVSGPSASFATAYSNLALCSRTRFERTAVADDLAVAMAAARRAVAEASSEDGDLAGFETNLALSLWVAGEYQEALANARTAYDRSLKTGGAANAAYTANFARMLDNLNSEPDRALRLWEQVAANRSSPVPLRIEAGVAVAQAHPPGSGERAAAYRTAAELLPEAAWHGIGPQSRLRRLKAWQGLARDASAAQLASHGPETALALLDGTLSQMWAREVRLSAEQARLHAVRADLALRFEELRRARAR